MAPASLTERLLEAHADGKGPFTHLGSAGSHLGERWFELVREGSDVDGDGGSELITIEGGYGDDGVNFLLATSRASASGQIRWERHLPYEWELWYGDSFVAFPDVTGDGVQDVVFLGIDERTISASAIFVGATRWTRDYGLLAIDGHDGEILWSHERTGVAYTASGVAVYENYLVNIDIDGDVDGDGAPDLLTQILDGPVVIGGSTPATDPVYTVEWTSGRSGKVVAGYTDDVGERIPRVIAGGDLTGDGRADAVELSEVRQVRKNDARPPYWIALNAAVVRVRSAAGAVVWTRTLDRDFFEFDAVDLDGSGVNEVVLHEGPFTALEGPTGATRYRLDPRPHLVGDLDGDGGPDLATMSLDAHGNPRLQTFRGANGTSLASHPAPGTYGYDSDEAGDLDGDGLGDLIITFHRDEGTSRSMAFRGIDLTTLWSSDRPWLWPLRSDVDGDGTDDINVGSRDSEGYCCATPLSLNRGSDLALIGTTGGSYDQAWLATTAQLSDDPGRELLVRAGSNGLAAYALAEPTEPLWEISLD